MAAPQGAGAWDSSRDLTRTVKGHRWGKLESVRVLKTSHGKTIGVLFLCDCGRHRRVHIREIKNREVPEGCKVCCPPPKPPTVKERTKRVRREHPHLYECWVQLLKGGDVCEGWKKSFIRFYDDMGVRPDGMRLCRHRRYEKHGPGNSYWGTVDGSPNSIYYRGTRVTQRWVCSEFGVSVRFIRRQIQQGVKDVDRIVLNWRLANAGRTRHT